MAAAGRFSYHKLKHHYPSAYEEDDNTNPTSTDCQKTAFEAALRARAWSRLRRVPVRRRLRVGGLGARLGRYLRSRRVRALTRVKLFWKKVVRRVRDSQAHFWDLFAGNYMFLQVNPTPLRKVAPAVDKSSKAMVEDSTSTRSDLRRTIISVDQIGSDSRQV